VGPTHFGTLGLGEVSALCTDNSRCVSTIGYLGGERGGVQIEQDNSLPQSRAFSSDLEGGINQFGQI